MTDRGDERKPGETVNIRSCRMGEDVVFLVTGGRAHIGAAATARPLEDGSVGGDTLSLPGHLEGEMAAELASMAALALNRTVAVLAGIHLERPSKRDVGRVVAEAKSRMRRMLASWDDEGRELDDHGTTAR